MLVSGSLPSAVGRGMQGWSVPVCWLSQTLALRINKNETGVPARSAVAELGTVFGSCLLNEPFRKPDGLQDRSGLVCRYLGKASMSIQCAG